MDKKIIYTTSTPGQTKKLGFLLAQAVLNRDSADKAFAVFLAGDLGAGKTQFMQGFAKGLGIKNMVSSPTFSIMKKYPFGAKKEIKNLYHVDCYRLRSAQELLPLGIENIIEDPANIVAVEWPDIVRELLPRDVLSIDFEVIGKNQRRITMSVQ